LVLSTALKIELYRTKNISLFIQAIWQSETQRIEAARGEVFIKANSPKESNLFRVLAQAKFSKL
jgi:hypothetical protein